MPNKQHLNPLLFVSDFVTDTDTSSPNSETVFPSSSYCNLKAVPKKFGSHSGIYHPMNSDGQSSEEYEGEDNDYISSEDSGPGVDVVTPPK
ncbi:hypothetical protein O181_086366 [Austropuccinia psidii MF-1]|uniref:Uncharacterized protein n=1 Tax=Austropuccinia psidii MF-1 TaxID=1389203 RepID=A0A9Q3FZX9_9BASI|nr:hypothetical protein [Austropuccinia psidii MF-1]